jgi:hypothetical protein
MVVIHSDACCCLGTSTPKPCRRRSWLGWWPSCSARARLRDENAALRDEIARLKGLQGRPKVKPSGMERATPPRRGRPKRKTKGSKTLRRVVEEEQILVIAAPPGSSFKGYEDFVVQDLRLEARVIRYRRQRDRIGSRPSAEGGCSSR